MTHCARCGRANDDLARFCEGCGQPMPTAAPSPAVPPPVSPPPQPPPTYAWSNTPTAETPYPSPPGGTLGGGYPTAPPVPQTFAPAQPPVPLGIRGAKIGRYWTVFSVGLVGVILLGVSIGLSWQTISSDGVTVNYFILGTACGSGSGVSECLALTNLPAAVVAAEALIIAAVVLGIVGIAFAVPGALGVPLRGAQGKVTSICSGLSFATALAAPSTYAGYTYYANAGLWASPSTAGAGWYSCLVAAILLVVAFSISLTARSEQAAGGFSPSMVPPMAAYPGAVASAAAGPVAAPVAAAPPAASPGATVYCRACGQPNFANSQTCVRCNARLT